MKICLLSSMHSANDKRVFEKEAVHLARAGYDVVHLCPGDTEGVLCERGVTTITYPRARGISGRLFQLGRLYRRAARIDADAYHCNEVDSWFVGVLLAIARGKKCIFDVHEHYPSTFADKRFPRWMHPAAARAVRAAFWVLVRFTDRVVLAKDSVAPDFPVAAEHRIVVKNYASLDAIRFATPDAGNREFGAGTVVHLGLFSKHRGWPQVLDAMAAMRHADTRLKVIGQINDGTGDEFRQRVRALGLSERVEFFEWMPFRDAFSHLVAAHVGLIAFQPGILNHVYAMPHKMFDYMAAGMAVICPAFAVEIAPIVEECGAGVLIDPTCPQDIAEKLDRLFDDRAALLEMGQRGRKAVEEKYNWDAEMEKLLRMYATLERRAAH